MTLPRKETGDGRAVMKEFIENALKLITNDKEWWKKNREKLKQYIGI